eukprot:Sspe_Gene.51810::Locus_28739_Transcript_1_1_Confidence_1.000_Length_1569::g.51810::m.51810
MCIDGGDARGYVELTTGECQEKRCLETKQTDCEADPYCEWKGGNQDPCVEKQCVKHRGEKECNHDDDCHWDVGVTPSLCSLKKCRRHETQQPCDADNECMWDAAKAKCVEKECKKLTDPCPCKQEPQCYWDATHPDGARCVDAQFGTCPTLDVVMVLDGSASMAKSFGRH